MKTFQKLAVLAVLLSLPVLLIGWVSKPSDGSVYIGKLKYEGGGDWYANDRTSLPNLFDFVRKNTQIGVAVQQEHVEPGSAQIFKYPLLYMTGHGNVVFSDQDVKNLRKYLLAGGFLMIDDNYGLHKYAVREMKKIFPQQDFVELPFSHPIFHQHYSFPNGLPKIHEHDGKPPKGFGIFHEGRLVCFMTLESDLGDGWESPEVHNNPPEVRQKALQMGANILIYALNN